MPHACLVTVPHSPMRLSSMTGDDLTDTVELPVLGEEERASTPDDTDEFELGGPDASARMKAHLFADGVIRFYRARTILLVDRDPQKFDRAWRYLSRLLPQDLPPVSRQPFFDLVYLMQEHSGQATSIPYKFSQKILEIADLIDAFVDEIDQLSETVGA
jgi:hypothetical protein